MISFKLGYRFDTDNWSLEGEKISSPEKLAAIKETLEISGPVLLEHKFLRQARGPRVAVFDDYEAFVEYLTENARAGDKVTVWSLWPYMRDTPPLAYGKCPAEDGVVPKGGAY